MLLHRTSCKNYADDLRQYIPLSLRNCASILSSHMHSRPSARPHLHWACTHTIFICVSCISNRMTKLPNCTNAQAVGLVLEGVHVHLRGNRVNGQDFVMTPCL